MSFAEILKGFCAICLIFAGILCPSGLALATLIILIGQDDLCPGPAHHPELRERSEQRGVTLTPFNNNLREFV